MQNESTLRQHWCVVLEILIPTQGERYSAEPGDRRRLLWRKASGLVPNVVRCVRAHKPIDWGGQVVTADGYRVLRDTELEALAEVRA